MCASDLCVLNVCPLPGWGVSTTTFHTLTPPLPLASAAAAAVAAGRHPPPPTPAALRYWTRWQWRRLCPRQGPPPPAGGATSTTPTPTTSLLHPFQRARAGGRLPPPATHHQRPRPRATSQPAYPTNQPTSPASHPTHHPRGGGGGEGGHALPLQPPRVLHHHPHRPLAVAVLGAAVLWGSGGEEGGVGFTSSGVGGPSDGRLLLPPAPPNPFLLYPGAS